MLVVVFVILALLLRALLAPFMLIATVVLSFAAALGFSAVIFDKIFHFAGTDTSFPLFVFIFLVALGIDYNIFLMTRVREETAARLHPRRRAHGSVCNRRGHHLGRPGAGRHLRRAGHAAAVTFFAEMGFAVAFGVLLDTIVVRSVLVTALKLDIGHRIWWPGQTLPPATPAHWHPRRAGSRHPVSPPRPGRMRATRKVFCLLRHLVSYVARSELAMTEAESIPDNQTTSAHDGPVIGGEMPATDRTPAQSQLGAVTIQESLDHLRRAAAATGELLGSISDSRADVPVPGLAWTLAETAAHLVALLRQSAAFTSGARDGAAERAALPASAGIGERTGARQRAGT